MKCLQKPYIKIYRAMKIYFTLPIVIFVVDEMFFLFLIPPYYILVSLKGFASQSALCAALYH
ncbi:hypothetical protein N500_0416 [Wolbachia pipientis wUni]|nr:hypothetical protein N500_0416 [Wolbachia pipientis wUni]